MVVVPMTVLLAPTVPSDCNVQVVIELRMRSGVDGAAPKEPDGPSLDGKPKPKPKKKLDNDVPKAVLVFHEVSNDCDGDFEVRVNWPHCPWSAISRGKTAKNLED